MERRGEEGMVGSVLVLLQVFSMGCADKAGMDE
jgi:hypothetical protein